jgi:hypothetical protein
VIRPPAASVSPEPLAVLLLPAPVEQFELQDHARELLAIPRVIALEPSRHRTPRLLRDAVPLRQARRLRFPGQPRAIVLYDPEQYRLARALLARYTEAELWYVRRPDAPQPTGTAAPDPDREELDQLAVQRATAERIIAPELDTARAGSPLRVRLQELEIISPRPFAPGARIGFG